MTPLRPADQRPQRGSRGANDSFNLAKLTCHMLAANLESARQRRKGDPFALTAAVVHETLKTYLKGMNPASEALAAGVRDAARGAMTAFLSRFLDVPGGAAAILRSAAAVAEELRLSPEALKHWAIQGIAEAGRSVPLVHLAVIETDIEALCSGGGRLFRLAVERRAGTSPASTLL